MWKPVYTLPRYACAILSKVQIWLLHIKLTIVIEITVNIMWRLDRIVHSICLLQMLYFWNSIFDNNTPCIYCKCLVFIFLLHWLYWFVSYFCKYFFYFAVRLYFICRRHSFQIFNHLIHQTELQMTLNATRNH